VCSFLHRISLLRSNLSNIFNCELPMELWFIFRTFAYFPLLFIQPPKQGGKIIMSKKSNHDSQRSRIHFPPQTCHDRRYSNSVWLQQFPLPIPHSYRHWSGINPSALILFQSSAIYDPSFTPAMPQLLPAFDANPMFSKSKQSRFHVGVGSIPEQHSWLTIIAGWPNGML